MIPSPRLPWNLAFSCRCRQTDKLTDGQTKTDTKREGKMGQTEKQSSRDSQTEINTKERGKRKRLLRKKKEMKLDNRNHHEIVFFQLNSFLA